MIEMLKGFKTYIVAILTAIYGIGIKAGWWPHDATIDLVLAGAGAAALRAGVKNTVIEEKKP